MTVYVVNSINVKESIKNIVYQGFMMQDQYTKYDISSKQLKFKLKVQFKISLDNMK